jgi:hypothetical protein
VGGAVPLFAEGGWGTCLDLPLMMAWDKNRRERARQEGGQGKGKGQGNTTQ